MSARKDPQRAKHGRPEQPIHAPRDGIEECHIGSSEFASAASVSSARRNSTAC